jgi:hypothetical protein
MKYRIKIVEYPSGLIEYYPQYRSFFTWHNFIETRLIPIRRTMFSDHYDSFTAETDVFRKTLDEAKDFLRQQNIKVSYDYNWKL